LINIIYPQWDLGNAKEMKFRREIQRLKDEIKWILKIFKGVSEKF